MNTHLDCIPCFLRQSLESVRRGTDDVHVQEEAMREVLRMTADLDLGQSPPSVGQAIRRRLRELTGVKDPYLAAKQHCNRLAMAALPELAALVKRATDPLLFFLLKVKGPVLARHVGLPLGAHAPLHHPGGEPTSSDEKTKSA